MDESNKPQPLTADDLAHMEHRAQRWSNAVGTVYHQFSRDVFRLLAERERLLRELAQHQ